MVLLHRLLKCSAMQIWLNQHRKQTKIHIFKNKLNLVNSSQVKESRFLGIRKAKRRLKIQLEKMRWRFTQIARLIMKNPKKVPLDLLFLLQGILILQCSLASQFYEEGQGYQTFWSMAPSILRKQGMPQNFNLKKNRRKQIEKQIEKSKRGKSKQKMDQQTLFEFPLEHLNSNLFKSNLLSFDENYKEQQSKMRQKLMKSGSNIRYITKEGFLNIQHFIQLKQIIKSLNKIYLMGCGCSNDREVVPTDTISRSLIKGFNTQVKKYVEKIEKQRLATTEDVQNFLAFFLNNEHQFSIISQSQEQYLNYLPLIREGTIKFLNCLPDYIHSNLIYAVSILKILSFFSLILFAFYANNEDKNRKLKQTDQLEMIKSIELIEDIVSNEMENHPLHNNIKFYLFFLKSAIEITPTDSKQGQNILKEFAIGLIQSALTLSMSDNLLESLGKGAVYIFKESKLYCLQRKFKVLFNIDKVKISVLKLLDKPNQEIALIKLIEPLQKFYTKVIKKSIDWEIWCYWIYALSDIIMHQRKYKISDLQNYQLSESEQNEIVHQINNEEFVWNYISNKTEKNQKFLDILKNEPLYHCQIDFLIGKYQLEGFQKMYLQKFTQDSKSGQDQIDDSLIIKNINFLAHIREVQQEYLRLNKKEKLTQAKLQRQVDLSSELIKKISQLELQLEQFIIWEGQFLIDENQDVILDTQLSELINQLVVNCEQHQKQISSYPQYKSLNELIETELKITHKLYKFRQDQCLRTICKEIRAICEKIKIDDKYIEMNQDQLKRKAAIIIKIIKSSFLFLRINISILLRRQVKFKKIQIERNDSYPASVQQNSEEMLNFYDYQLTNDSLQILYQLVQQLKSFENTKNQKNRIKNKVKIVIFGRLSIFQFQYSQLLEIIQINRDDAISQKIVYELCLDICKDFGEYQTSLKGGLKLIVNLLKFEKTMKDQRTESGSEVLQDDSELKKLKEFLDSFSAKNYQEIKIEISKHFNDFFNYLKRFTEALNQQQSKANKDEDFLEQKKKKKCEKLKNIELCLEALLNMDIQKLDNILEFVKQISNQIKEAQDVMQAGDQNIQEIDQFQKKIDFSNNCQGDMKDGDQNIEEINQYQKEIDISNNSQGDMKDGDQNIEEIDQFQKENDFFNNSQGDMKAGDQKKQEIDQFEKEINFFKNLKKDTKKHQKITQQTIEKINNDIIPYLDNILDNEKQLFNLQSLQQRISIESIRTSIQKYRQQLEEIIKQQLKVNQTINFVSTFNSQTLDDREFLDLPKEAEREIYFLLDQVGSKEQSQEQQNIYDKYKEQISDIIDQHQWRIRQTIVYSLMQIKDRCLQEESYKVVAGLLVKFRILETDKRIKQLFSEQKIVQELSQITAQYWPTQEESIKKIIKQKLKELDLLSVEISSERIPERRTALIKQFNKEQDEINEQIKNIESLSSSLGITVLFLQDIKSNLLRIENKLQELQDSVNEMGQNIKFLMGRPFNDLFEVRMKKVLEQAEIFKAEKVYVPIKTREKDFEKGGWDEETPLFTDEIIGEGEINEFLWQQQKSSLLIHGLAGSGKSTAARKIEEFLWSLYKKANLNTELIPNIPIFIPLPQLKDPLYSAVEETLKSDNYRFNERNIEELKNAVEKGKYRIIIIMDSYDELNQQQIGSNLNISNKLSKWRSNQDTKTYPKIITTSRSELFTITNYHTWFMPESNDLKFFKEIQLVKFNKQQVKQYFEQYYKLSEKIIYREHSDNQDIIQFEKTWKQEKQNLQIEKIVKKEQIYLVEQLIKELWKPQKYEDNIQAMKLESLLETAFMLEIVVVVLPEIVSKKQNKVLIKNQFIEKYSENSTDSLKFWNSLNEQKYDSFWSKYLNAFTSQEIKQVIEDQFKNHDKFKEISAALLQQPLTSYDFYLQFFHHYFNREIQKIREKGGHVSITDLWKFTQQLAVKMTLNNLSTVHYEQTSLLFKKKQEDWTDQFFDNNGETGLIRCQLRKCIPLNQKNNNYSFNHKSLQEFLVAKWFIENIKTIQEEELFNNKNWQDDFLQGPVRFVSEKLKNDENVQKLLFSIIKPSAEELKNDKNVQEFSMIKQNTEKLKNDENVEEFSMIKQNTEKLKNDENVEEFSMIKQNTEKLKNDENVQKLLFEMIKPSAEKLKNDENVQEFSMIKQNAEKLKNDENVQEFSMIKQSESKTKSIRSASNSIHLLNQMNYDFQGKDLSKIVLENVELSGINFYKANLSQSIFKEVNVSHCNFSEANLTQVKWEKTRLNELARIKIRDEVVEFIEYIDENCLFVQYENKEIECYNPNNSEENHNYSFLCMYMEKQRLRKIIKLNQQKNDGLVVLEGYIVYIVNYQNDEIINKIKFNDFNIDQIFVSDDEEKLFFIGYHKVAEFNLNQLIKNQSQVNSEDKKGQNDHEFNEQFPGIEGKIFSYKEKKKDFQVSNNLIVCKSQICDLNSKQIIAKAPFFDNRLREQFDFKNSLLALVSESLKILVYHLSDFNSPKLLQGHQIVIEGLKIVKNGERLLSYDHDNVISWDLVKFTKINSLKLNFTKIAFNRTSLIFCIAQKQEHGHILQFWDIEQSFSKLKLSDSDKDFQEIDQCALAFNGQYAVSAGVNIQIWEIQSGNQFGKTIKLELLDQSDIQCLQFSIDSLTFYASFFGGYIYQWDVATQNLQYKINNFGDRVYYIFSIDKDRILTHQEDNVIKLWNMRNNSFQLIYNHDDNEIVQEFKSERSKENYELSKGYPLILSEVGYGSCEIDIYKMKWIRNDFALKQEKQNQNIFSLYNDRFYFRCKKIYFDGDNQNILDLHQKDSDTIFILKWSESENIFIIESRENKDDKIGDIINQIEITQIEEHINCFDMNEDISYFGGMQGTLTAYDIVSREIQYSFKPHQQKITQIKYLSDHKLVLTVSEDAKIILSYREKIIDQKPEKSEKPEKPEKSEKPNGQPILFLYVSKDQHEIMIGTQKSLSLYLIENQTLIFIESFDQFVNIGFVWADFEEFIIRVFDNGQPFQADFGLKRISKHLQSKFKHQPQSISYDYDSKNIFTTDDSGIISCWDLNGNKIQELIIYQPEEYEELQYLEIYKTTIMIYTNRRFMIYDQEKKDLKSFKNLDNGYKFLYKDELFEIYVTQKHIINHRKKIEIGWRKKKHIKRFDKKNNLFLIQFSDTLFQIYNLDTLALQYDCSRVKELYCDNVELDGAIITNLEGVDIKPIFIQKSQRIKVLGRIKC